MSTTKKGSKPTTRSSKAEKASFDKLISALEKEKEDYVLPRVQKTLFYIAGVVSAIAPVILFWGGGQYTNAKWSPVYEGHVHENIIWYLVVVVVTAVLLGHTYMILASRTRKQLLLSREPVADSERAVQNLKRVTGNESAYYALFASNAVFLALFLLNVRYVLAAQEFSERVNFAFASIVAAGATAGIVVLKAL